MNAVCVEGCGRVTEECCTSGIVVKSKVGWLFLHCDGRRESELECQQAMFGDVALSVSLEKLTFG